MLTLDFLPGIVWKNESITFLSMREYEHQKQPNAALPYRIMPRAASDRAPDLDNDRWCGRKRKQSRCAVNCNKLPPATYAYTRAVNCTNAGST
jgi:hypothetical protein